MVTVAGDDMRHVTDNGLDLIKRFEGFSPTIYICPGGWPTIGYGHVVRKLERDQYMAGIDKNIGAALLQSDIGASERALLRLIRVPVNDGQFDALVSFTFNLGAGALQRSTLRRKVNREEHGAVPAEFRRWVWAGGRRSAGLARRREAEIDRYTN
jgi:GH24 family phage-related lysozyme (muramidase)